MAGRCPLLCSLVGIVLGLATPALGQDDPDPYAPIGSTGLLPRGGPYLGAALVGHAVQSTYGIGGHAYVGLRRDLFQPAIGALGVALEGYTGVVQGNFEAGGRVFAAIRPLRLQFGLVAGARNAWPPTFAVTFEDPVVRGGLLRRGGALRVEWMPAGGHAAVGIMVPFHQAWIGRTRPRRITLEAPPHPRVRLPPSPTDPELVATVDSLRDAATWIDELTTPFVDAALETNEPWLKAIEAAREKMSRGRTYPAEVATYHRLLHRLFGLALQSGGPGADSVTDAARRSLLDELVIPANRHFGTVRPPATFRAFRALAFSRFDSWALQAAAVPSAERDEVRSAFRGVLDVLEEVERRARARWGDSRLIWMPFQLALRPEDHDSQEELDALLERVLDRPLLPGSDYVYLINEAFSPELIQSLHAAEDYHVLWIHDFAGVDPSGNVDRVAHRVVVEGYLEALTQAARRFDQTGQLPVFLILLDRWYFDGRKGRWWMALLQDPLGHELRLPSEAVELEQAVRDAQRELRDAVAGSTRLQAEAARRGRDWLRRYVKVHVNLTYPADLSFRAATPGRLVLREFPDDFMRDHRKVVFWDLTEEDPARGAALFTGEGVGEHYEGASWEDRTLLVRGPAVIELKRQARAVLLAHGIPESRVPLPLQARPFPADYQTRVDSLAAEWTSRIVQVHNATGYGDKSASALKASLYNLMPAGCRILAPDSQWSSFFWAGMLVGTALRGCKVYVIAPRSDNAPYGSAFVQNILTHDVLEGYLQLRENLVEAFEASGGGLHVGLFGEDIGTRSLADRYRAVQQGLATLPDVFPFPPATLDRLRNQPLLDSLLALAGPWPGTGQDREVRYPKLHLKSQLFMSAEGAERILADPGWFDVFFAYVWSRVEEFALTPSHAATGRMMPGSLAPIEETLRRAPDSARARDVFYFTVGSHNQNDRSLLLDGEILCLVAGPESLGSLIDFVAIVTRSTWLKTQEELHALIPPQSRTKVRIARLLRSLF